MLIYVKLETHLRCEKGNSIAEYNYPPDAPFRFDKFRVIIIDISIVITLVLYHSFLVTFPGHLKHVLLLRHLTSWHHTLLRSLHHTLILLILLVLLVYLLLPRPRLRVLNGETLDFLNLVWRDGLYIALILLRRGSALVMQDTLVSDLRHGRLDLWWVRRSWLLLRSGDLLWVNLTLTSLSLLHHHLLHLLLLCRVGRSLERRQRFLCLPDQPPWNFMLCCQKLGRHAGYVTLQIVALAEMILDKAQNPNLIT